MARVIVVERERYLRNILSAWLARSGHDVVAVASVEAATQALEQGGADVLIADGHQSALDEVRWVQAVVERDPLVYVAFVLVSVSNARDLMNAVSDPRVHVLPKPFSPTRLLERINRTVTSARPRQLPVLKLVAGGAA